jgi:hypothetical protein
MHASTQLSNARAHLPRQLRDANGARSQWRRPVCGHICKLRAAGVCDPLNVQELDRSGERFPLPSFPSFPLTGPGEPTGNRLRQFGLGRRREPGGNADVQGRRRVDRRGENSVRCLQPGATSVCMYQCVLVAGYRSKGIAMIYAAGWGGASPDALNLPAQVSCKHAACLRNNLYMSEEFKKKKCGPFFEDWKKCFDAEVITSSNVCVCVHSLPSLPLLLLLFTPCL